MRLLKLGIGWNEIFTLEDKDVAHLIGIDLAINEMEQESLKNSY